jgi:hypothetical protein
MYTKTNYLEVKMLRKPKKLMVLKMRIKEKFGSNIAFAFSIGESDPLVSRACNGWQHLNADRKELWAKALDSDVAAIFPDQSE